jgi:predicted RNA-binding Zn-ribbon protein involved in translation (DUF1610 family)
VGLKYQRNRGKRMNKECSSCRKLEAIIATGDKAPKWVCYDCGEPIVPPEERSLSETASDE